MTALGIQWNLHTPWHLQSSGQVEKMNGEIKKHLLKLVIEAKMPWIWLLPLALARIRARLMRDIQLSPSELMFGIPYPCNSQPSGGLEINDVYLKQYVARILPLVKSFRREAQLAQTLPLDFCCSQHPSRRLGPS